MFAILDYSSALEYSIIRRYTNIVYYCYCRNWYCCSYCEASVSVFGRYGWARIRTLYGFNMVVVCLLQVVVLMNEAFPLDSMICHGVHSFPHWMNR